MDPAELGITEILGFQINVASVNYPELAQLEKTFFMLIVEDSGCEVTSVTYDVSDIVYVLNSDANVFTITLSQEPDCGYLATDVFFYPSDVAGLSMDYSQYTLDSEVDIMVISSLATAGQADVQI